MQKSKKAFLIGLAFFWACLAFARDPFLVCHYADQNDKAGWAWADISKGNFIQLYGTYRQATSEVVFSEHYYSENDLKKICDYTIRNLSEKYKQNYRLIQMRAGTSAYWYDYPLQFEALQISPSEKASFSISELIDFLIPNELPMVTESALLARFLEISDQELSERLEMLAKIDEVTRYLLEKSKKRALYQFDHIRPDLYKLAFASHFTAIEAFLNYSYFGPHVKEVPTGFAHNKFVQSGRSDIEKFFDQKLEIFKREKIIQVDNVQDRTFLFHYFRDVIFSMIDYRIKIEKSNATVKKWVKSDFDPTVFDLDRHLQFDLTLGISYLKSYLDIVRIRKKMPPSKVMHLFNANRPKRPRDLPKLLRDEVLSQDMPSQDEFTSVSPQSKQEPQSEYKGELKSEPLVHTEPPVELRRLPRQRTPGGMNVKAERLARRPTEQAVEGSSPEKLRLDSKSLDILSKLTDAGRKDRTVTVDQYFILLQEFVRQNPEYFEEAWIENPSGITIVIWFHLKEGGYKSYGIHRPHGRESNRVIPPAYMKRYAKLFSKLFGIESLDQIDIRD